MSIIEKNLFVYSNKYEEEKNYWMKKLGDETTKCAFPHDYIEKQDMELERKAISIELPMDVVRETDRICGNSNIKRYIMLLASLKVLLHKYTLNEDITVGGSIFSKDCSTDFVNNILPFRDRINSEASFKDLLRDVTTTISDADRYQNYPMDYIFEQIGGKPFEVALILENIQNKEFMRKYTSDIELVLSYEDGCINGILDYNCRLYQPNTINRIKQHYINTIKALIENPNKKICEIEILSHEDKNIIIFEFNNTKVEYSNNKTLHQLFEEQVNRTPNNIAVSFGDINLNYNELNEKANQLGRELRNAGLKKGDVAAIIINRSIEMIIGVLGILKAGAAYIPLEPYLPEARISKIINDLNIEFIITNGDQIEHVCKIHKESSRPMNILCIGENEEYNIEKNNNINIIPKSKIMLNPIHNLEPISEALDLAYVIFTSGSTGTPKGVGVIHRPVINVIEWVNKTFNISNDDKLLFITSLGFDLSVYDIFGTLASGASLQIMTEDDVRNPYKLANVIYNDGITFWDSAPVALQQLVPILSEKNYSDKSNKLRLVFLSGDWIPVDMPDFLRSIFKKAEIVSLGGATEATIWSNYYTIGTVKPEWPSIPYGKPIQNANYYILDKNLKLCPIGVEGDLYIGGECLAEGYINDKQLTDNKFIANPFRQGERMYRTGDLARWFEDGNMEFRGRRDSQIKIRGYRIELGEIESQLRKHKSIKDAVVIAQKRGNDSYLSAFIIENTKITATEIREYLSNNLPYYMIPSHFTVIDKFPLTSNGKIDRKVLSEIDDNDNTTTQYVAPTNELESELCDIWRDILNIDNVGINNDFTELGGHSLLVIQLLYVISKKYNVHITASEFYYEPTICGVCKRIEYSRKQQDKGYDKISDLTKQLNTEFNKKFIYKRYTANKKEYLILFTDADEADVKEYLKVNVTGEQCPNYIRPLSQLDGDHQVEGKEIYYQELSSAVGLLTYFDDDKLRNMTDKIINQNENLYKTIKKGSVTDRYNSHYYQNYYLDVNFRSVISIQIKVLNECNLNNIMLAITQLINNNTLMRAEIVKEKEVCEFIEHKMLDEVDLDCIDISEYEETLKDSIKDKIAESLGAYIKSKNVLNNILFSIAVIKEDFKNYTLIFSFDHNIFDGGSKNALERNFYRCYSKALKKDYTDFYIESTPKYKDIIEEIEKCTTKEKAEEFKNDPYFLKLRKSVSSINECFPNLKNPIKFSDPICLEYYYDKNNCEYDSADKQIGAALWLSIQICGIIFETTDIPVKILSDGRQLGKINYSNLLGDCHINIPALFNLREKNIVNYYRRLVELEDKYMKIKSIHFGIIYTDEDIKKVYKSIPINLNFIGHITPKYEKELLENVKSLKVTTRYPLMAYLIDNKIGVVLYNGIPAEKLDIIKRLSL